MVVANLDEKSQVSSGGPLPDYEFEELQHALLNNKPKGILPEDSSTVVIETENFEDIVATEFQEQQRPLLENKTKDALPEDSSTVEVEAENHEDIVATGLRELQLTLLENKTKDTLPATVLVIEPGNPQNNVPTVPSRQGCNERENHEAISRSGVSFKDKYIMFPMALFLGMLILGVLILVVILIVGVICGTTTLCSKGQPPSQDMKIINSSGSSLDEPTPPLQDVKILNSSGSSLGEPTPPMQDVEILNCSGSSLDMPIWLFGRKTIYKNGHLVNQTLAKICGLNVMDGSLIITKPIKCPGQYSCEIGQKMETYRIGFRHIQQN